METSVPFDTTVEILIYVFLALAVLCIGLASTMAEMVALLRDRAKLTRVLVANLVIGPVAALAIIGLIPMAPAAASVLLLLAFAPGGINAVQFSTKAPGQLAAAGGLLFLLSAISLLTATVAAVFVLPAGASTGLPLGELMLRIVVLIVGPLAIGAALRSRAPDLAEKLYKPAMLVSTLAFIASVLISMSVRQEALGELGTGSAVAFLLFVLVMMAAGWALGGPEFEGRQVLAVSTNLRNVGLVYVIVDGCCPGSMLSTAVLAFMAVVVPPNLVLTVACALWRKRHAG